MPQQVPPSSQPPHLMLLRRRKPVYRLRRLEYPPKDNRHSTAATSSLVAEPEGADPTSNGDVRELRSRLESSLRASARVPALEATIDRLERDATSIRGELEALKNQQAAIDKEKAEAEEKALKARAEMENQRRRLAKEKDDARKFASEEVLTSLMSVIDHFGMALDSMESATEVAPVRQGVTMIRRELISVVSQQGMIEIPALPGATFDPTIHDAVATGSDPALPDGSVIEVMRSGWVLNGKVLRPAMVKVNKLISIRTPLPVDPIEPGPLPDEVP